MKRIFIIFFTFLVGIANAQTKKVAILDFENTSGKTEFDGLGKTLSNMLITDLKNNIDPKKVEFYERGQLNKLLDEQNLQKTKDFDKKTAVDFGKLSGVHYVFVGSLFVLDGSCNMSSRLIDVQTSKIVLSKDVGGKIEEWLSLTSELAESISMEINNPIYFEKNHKKATSEIVLKTYAKGIIAYDKRNFDEATAKFTQVLLIDENFTYAQYDLDKIIDLKKKNEKLKKIEEIVDFEKIFYPVSDVAIEQPHGIKQAEAWGKAMNLIFDYLSSLDKLKDYIDDFIEISSDYPPDVLIDYDSETRYELGLGEDILNFNECVSIFRKRASILVKALYYQFDVPLDEKRNQLWRTQSFYEWIIDNIILPNLIRLEYGVLKNNIVECTGEYIFYPDGKVKSDELITYTLNLIMQVDEMMDDDDADKSETLKRLEKLKRLKIHYKI